MRFATSPRTPAIAEAASVRAAVLVIALTTIYACAFMDRVILGLLVDPIKTDLHVSDTQMGLLFGIAFAALYALGNLPAGYLVDRFNRRMLIFAASLAWAAMTVVCAAAGGFGQLFWGRAGVGLTEAVIGPASFSLIRNGVHERFRGTAFSVFAMAPLIGGASALMGGGALLHAAKAGKLAALGLPQVAAPWRLVLAIVGLIAVPISLLVFTFREPVRLRGAGAVPEQAGTAKEAIAHVRKNLAVYVPLVAYVTFASMMSFGQSAWLTAAVSRRWSMTPEHLGPILGALTLFCGVLGLLLTGFLLRLMASAGRDIRNFGALAAVGTAAGFAGCAFAPVFAASIACAGIGLFFVGASYPIGATTLSQITPAPLMGRTTGAYFIFQALLGQALGPTLIAASSTYLFGGAAGLPRGFGVVMLLFGVASVAAALALRRALARRPLEDLSRIA